MLLNLRHSFTIAITIVLCGFCAVSRAQTLTPEHYSFKVGGWELNELKDTNGVSLGFWAIPRSALGVGNIRRMWFESLPNDDWAVWAYEPVQASAVAADLYANGMDHESLVFFYSRERKALESLPDQNVDGGVQGLVDKGFIVGDPLVDTVGALNDPTPMIDLLADVSYPIAPGMTEMLVNGTAGTNVNMNQATKQLLNCLRSTSTSCGECVCVSAEGPIDRSPWTVTQTNMPPPDNRIRCDYTRVVTHSYWQTGEYPDDCTDCTVGSPSSPATWTETEEYTDFWLEETECPDEPLMAR